MTAPHDGPLPGPDVTPGPPSTRAAAEAVFRRALRDTVLLLVALTVLGVLVGVLVAGLAGVWGALIGVGLAAVFSGTTLVAMLRTTHAAPQVMAGIVMGSWLAKVLVVIVALALLRGLDFYSAPVLAGVLAIGAIGSALLDYRAVSTGRVPYVEPGEGGRP